MESARKAKLGQRWVCFKCNLRFYDLNKPDPICPKCSANQQESPEFHKPAKKRPAKKAAAKKDVVVAAPVEEIEVRSRGGGGDEEIDEDFSEESEFDLEDLEIDEAAGGDDDDSVGIVEVEED
jgi:uncharacterized protein (TIGR02300 family)